MKRLAFLTLHSRKCGCPSCTSRRGLHRALVFFAFLLLLALTVRSAVRGEDGPKKKADSPDVVIHLPPVPPTPQPQPPAPGAALSLPTGKLLLVTSPTVELFFRWAARDGSELSIKAIKTPATVFGDFVDPQSGDDDGRTISDPYAYIIRARTGGVGNLVIVPAGVKAASSIVSQAIDVGGIPPVPPNPITVSISPTSATVPINGKQQFTAAASQGGVKWSVGGAGTIDQQGLFTAGSAAGTATIVAASSVDPTKTATATVTVTDGPPPNPLTAALQAAYNQETFVGKADHLKNLTSIYKGIPGLLDNADLSANIKTDGDLIATIAAAEKALQLNAADMPKLHKVTGDDIAAVLKPTKQTPLDRTAAKAEFKKLADALAGVR